MSEQKAGATVELVTKITTKAVFGKVDIGDVVKFDEANPGQTMPLYDVLGIAGTFKVGESQMGEYVKFAGQFKAVNLTNGKQFRSGAAILPKPAQELIAGALAGENTNSASFALRIGVKRDKTAATGYVFAVSSLIPMADADPLALLEKQVIAALPAPTQASEQASQGDASKGKGKK